MSRTALLPQREAEYWKHRRAPNMAVSFWAGGHIHPKRLDKTFVNTSMSLGAYWRAQEERFVSMEVTKPNCNSNLSMTNHIESQSGPSFGFQVPSNHTIKLSGPSMSQSLNIPEKSQKKLVETLLGPGGIPSARQLEPWKKILSVAENRKIAFETCKELVMCGKIQSLRGTANVWKGKS